jgi:hypothetical protein
MNRDCIAEPISFLRLERHLQGGAKASERTRVDAHLAQCGACRACFEELQADTTQLPDWASVMANAGARAAASERAALPPRLAGRSLRRAGWTAALAAAAAALLAIVGREPWDASELPPARIHIKGGELALTLIREHEGSVAQDAERFSPGDRFMARVTCPTDRPQAFELVVYEGEQASFPLDSRARLDCGNAVLLPGAFALTRASEHVVCAIVADAVPDRAALRRSGPGGLPRESVCQRLRPLRD